MKPLITIDANLRTAIAAIFLIVFAAISNKILSEVVDPSTEARHWAWALGSGLVGLLIAAGWFYLVGAKNEDDKYAENKRGHLQSIDKVILLIYTPFIALVNLWL